MEVFFGIIAAIFAYLWFKNRSELAKLSKYKGVDNLEEQISTLTAKKENITTQTYKAENTLAQLLKSISETEIEAQILDYGIYKPVFDLDSSEKYKQELTKIVAQQETLIKQGKAAICSIEWSVGGSVEAGRKMSQQSIKLMLRAFNGEADAAIAKAKWNNAGQMTSRIEKSFEAINKMGTSNNILVQSQYLKLKLKELQLEVEREEKLNQEKEEQKAIREQMREEEKVRKEIEKAQKQAFDEEEKYNKALEKAKQEIGKATGEQLSKLEQQIKLLEDSLAIAKQNKARAISQAQLTKSGHVYIISNIGAFGEDVFKIGMTRRLEPLDRVKELGDASVPFEFDVHAMIYSENAPELENIFHKKFNEKRLNLVNQRREFFNVSITEIQKLAEEMKLAFTLTKLAEAKQYRESVKLREQHITPVFDEAVNEQEFSASVVE